MKKILTEKTIQKLLTIRLQRSAYISVLQQMKVLDFAVISYYL
jgi:energy-converting hydrogenase Eha subunit C